MNCLQTAYYLTRLKMIYFIVAAAKCTVFVYLELRKAFHNPPNNLPQN